MTGDAAETKGTAVKTAEQEQDTGEVALPPGVQEALGELVKAAKERSHRRK